MKCTVFSDSKTTANAIKPTHNVTNPSGKKNIQYYTNLHVNRLENWWTVIYSPMVDCTLKFFTRKGSMSVPNVKYMVVVEMLILLSRQGTHRRHGVQRTAYLSIGGDHRNSVTLPTGDPRTNYYRRSTITRITYNCTIILNII